MMERLEAAEKGREFEVEKLRMELDGLSHSGVTADEFLEEFSRLAERARALRDPDPATLWRLDHTGRLLALLKGSKGMTKEEFVAGTLALAEKRPPAFS